MSDNLRFDLGTLAVENYVAGRLAFRHAGLRVTGHLLHRAIEYVFKAALATSLSLDELKKLNHSLVRLHARLADQWTPLASNRHTLTVQKIDRWEKIRYPSHPNGKGMSLLISPFPLPADWKGVRTDGRPQGDAYELVIQDADSLFAEGLAAAQLNPEAFFMGLSELAREQVLQFNEVDVIVNACQRASR